MIVIAPRVNRVIVARLALPIMCMSVARAAEPTTWAVSPGGGSDSSIALRTASTDSLALVVPWSPARLSIT